jgi:hypothetical protein
MVLFSKPIARIYVNELRTFLDPSVVPVFSPDAVLDVGDFCSFEDGRLISRGNVADRGVALHVDETPTSAFEFASSGKVSLSPSVTLPNPAGGELLKTVLSFTKARAVVASYQNGVERSVSDADAFAEQLMQLWYGKTLRTDRVVVWSVRRAVGGTVLVSEDDDNQVEIYADSALLGPVGITLAGLAAGVTFGAERKATWKMSSGAMPLVVWARVLKLSKDQAEVVDAFGFEASAANVPAIKPVAFTTDDLLGLL